MSDNTRFRADGSFRSIEGRKKRSVIVDKLDRIDFTDLSRIDSMTIHTVVELLGAVESRQAGYPYKPAKRPGRWGRIALSPPGEHPSDRLADDISAPRVACNDRGADRKPEGGPDDR